MENRVGAMQLRPGEKKKKINNFTLSEIHSSDDKKVEFVIWSNEATWRLVLQFLQVIL